MKQIVLAKSSSGEPYQVEFSHDGKSVRVFCHCPAGITQKLCKHKLALIQGDGGMLYDASQLTILEQITAWEGFNHLRALAIAYVADMAAIEADKIRLLEREKTLKSKIGYAFARGGSAQ